MQTSDLRAKFTKCTKEEATADVPITWFAAAAAHHFLLFCSSSSFFLPPPAASAFFSSSFARCSSSALQTRHMQHIALGDKLATLASASLNETLLLINACSASTERTCDNFRVRRTKR